MSKARITYRLDDSRQNMNKQPSVERSERKVVPLHAEETAKIGQEDGEKAEKKRAVNDRRPILNQFTSDFGSWSSPFDEETLRLEQMIRQSGGIGQPTASASSRRDEAPSIYPNAGGGSFRADGEFVTRRHEPEVVDEDYGVKVVRRGGGFSWLKAISTVSAAVITGLFIGMFALYLLGGNKTVDTLSRNSALPGGTDSPSAGGAPTVGTQQSSAGALPQGNVSSSSDTSGMLAVHIPAQTYYLLQNGVFSSRQGADQAQQQLKDNGMAAYTDQTQQYAVFAGITSSQNDAEYLRQMLADKHLDSYIKAFDLPQVEKISWDGSDAETITSYFAEGRKLSKIMSSLTLLHLQEDNPQQLDEQTAKTLQQEHQIWASAAVKLEATAPKSIAQDIQNMNRTMNSAVMAMEEYDKNPSRFHLWQVQAVLMQYIVTENELWGKLQAQS